MIRDEALKLALEAAYLAGFNASGEGWNGEYPFGDYSQQPEQDKNWYAERDDFIKQALAAPVQEPVEVDQDTMELAESVGLIGPASRTHDLHAAIQRFHDLICMNATIKAAKMAADAIRESTLPAAPVAWKWHQAPIKTSWGHEMVVADLAIGKDNTVSVYCERDQTAKVEAMFNPPAAAPVQEPVAWICNHYEEGVKNDVDYWQDDIDALPVGTPLYTTPPAAPDLQAELEATNRQVEILSDALAESRRGVAALKAVQEPVAWGVFEGGNLHDMFFTKEEADNMAHLKGLHAEIRPLTTPPAAQPAVPDALTSADIQEHIEYVAGWNDCRQAMLEMMK